MTPLPDQLIDDLRLLEPPEPWRVNPWIAAALILLALGVWWYVRHRRATHDVRQQAKLEKAAYHDALADLEKLFALVDQEQSRPYAIESSAIVRRYIESRFQLSAPRRSTEEFLVEATKSPSLAPEYQALLAEFLRICDLLKFARTLANRSELHQLHEAAVRFVKETHRTPAAPAVAA
jgi:hypothetical protein